MSSHLLPTTFDSEMEAVAEKQSNRLTRFLGGHLQKMSPQRAILIDVVLLGVTGCSDYLVGANVSLLVFYLIPICFATWFLGARFGLVTAILSVGIWAFSNDLAAGSLQHSPFVSGWNILSAFSFFTIIIILLSNFELFLRSLETRVAERTVALKREMMERRRLEKEILEISEEEQRRIGHDLHDTVCQQLAGTRMALEVLEKKLSNRSIPETADVSEIIQLVVKALQLTRNLARGLSPVAMTPGGLMDAFHQLADQISRTHEISCTLDYDDPLFIEDTTVATNLFLIAQEAVNNAVKHSRCSRIVIKLAASDDLFHLRIEDNGVGLRTSEHSGMGMRIMKYRAMMINATCDIEANPSGGTTVLCTLRKPPVSV